MSKLKRWDFVQEVAAIYKLGLEVASREKIFAPFFFSEGALPPNTLRFKGRATLILVSIRQISVQSFNAK